MNDEIPDSLENLQKREADAHGQAALLLVESLIHGLIEKKVLSVEEAVEIVDVATEVNIESGSDRGEAPATLQASINLLQDISASLRFDLGDQVQGINPK